MKALVTGGAGFVGSTLVDALLDAGWEVVVLDDLSTGLADNVNAQARWIEGDVADSELLAAAMSGCDTVFHQAARRAVPYSIHHPLETDRVNVGGTLAVMVAARHAEVRRVVTASSSSVYGGAARLPSSEGDTLAPRSPYAVSKLAAESYCRVFWELFGLETVSLRYFNVYGPRQRPDSPYAAVIPLFIDALVSGRPPEVHGDGLQSRDFTFVDDAVAANLRASQAPAEACAGRAYNVAGGRAHTLMELLELLEHELGTRIEPVHTVPRPGDVRHSWADVGAAERHLGHRPSVSLVEGLRRTASWFDRAPA